MIIYDDNQLRNTGIYFPHSASVSFTAAAGGQYPMLAVYENTAIMGWSGVTASPASKYITFNIGFSTLTAPIGGVNYGIRMPIPDPI